MSTKPLMLEGITPREPAEPNEGMLHKFRREKQQLEEEILALRRELDDVNREREKLDRTVRNLRNQLGPLHRALRAVFGEIELAIGEEEYTASDPSDSAPQSNSTRTDPRWESYKQNFPGAPAQIIDALLAHGQMKMTHLAKLLKRDYSTIKGAVKKLKDAGAVVGETGPDGGVRLK